MSDQRFLDGLVAIRRDLHQHPELSWKEERTAAKVADRLRELGLTPRTGIARTGIIADIPGVRDGPLVALRADLDALPLEEETGLEFSSVRPGVMHACGHDGHVAILLGAAELLLRNDPPPVPVRLVFQPAEELAQGAKEMISAGALEGVQAIFGGHIDREFEIGTVVVSEGTVNACTDAFTITVAGRGCHAARPHQGVDAALIASQIVVALQTVVSRELDPGEPAVLTVGTIDAGRAPNVVADRAVLEGTLRAIHPATRNRLREALRRISESTASSLRGSAQVTFGTGTPPVINPAESVARARAAGAATVGEDSVVEMTYVNMGGEDFGYYLEELPGCFVRFGSITPGVEPTRQHSSKFDFDERVLEIGARYYYNLIRGFDG